MTTSISRFPLPRYGRWGFYALVVLAAAGGCNRSEDPRPRRSVEPLNLVTTNYPLKYFADRITNGESDARFPVPEGQSHLTWRPTDAEMRDIRLADRVFTNGPELVGWLREADVSSERVVDTTHIFADYLLRTDATLATASKSADEENAAPFDRLTWLNPRLAVHQAETILETLARANPTLALDYQKNFNELLPDLERLDAMLTRITSEYANEPLLAAVPKYNYLANRGGLNLKSLDWPTDRAPEEDQWSELRTVLKGHPAKWMLWPSDPKPEVAGRLQSMGVKSTVFDPCEFPPKSGNFLSTMRQNYERLEELFQSLATTPLPSVLQGLPRELRDPNLPQEDATRSVAPLLPRIPAEPGEQPLPRERITPTDADER